MLNSFVLSNILLSRNYMSDAYSILCRKMNSHCEMKIQCSPLILGFQEEVKIENGEGQG